jgi:DNA mismatch endonuclease (patch repair protein)
MDNLTEEQRTKTMKAVKSRGSKIEKMMLEALSSKRIAPIEPHADDLPGNPDFVHRPAEVAVFVDSCYWHGCPEHFSMPDSNRDYWEQKIQRNKERDQEVTAQLEDSGWLVKRIWGHSVKNQRTRRWWATRIETLVQARTR